MLLVPSDPLRPRRLAAHFAAEANAARESGIEVALVDHDALTTQDGASQAVRRVPASEDAVYRGWMLPSEQYAAFAEALAQRGVTVRTTAEQYRRAHELPGWFSALAELTPRSVWTSGTDRAAFDRAREELGPGPAVLRDYTKSMKHYWSEAAYIPELNDATAAWAVASRFRELRADDLAGGFVLREFEDFTSHEVRTWWTDGECRLVGPHPDTPHDAPADPDLGSVRTPIAALQLPFVTVDLVQDADGRWRVVEIGDGQVSGRPDAIAAEAMIAMLQSRQSLRPNAPVQS